MTSGVRWGRGRLSRTQSVSDLFWSKEFGVLCRGVVESISVGEIGKPHVTRSRVPPEAQARSSCAHLRKSQEAKVERGR